MHRYQAMRQSSMNGFPSILGLRHVKCAMEAFNPPYLTGCGKEDLFPGKWISSASANTRPAVNSPCRKHSFDSFDE